MPAENRRIVGPEISQPVALRQRKRHPKPLVITVTCFLKERHLSGLLTLPLFARRSEATVCGKIVEKSMSSVLCVSLS